MSLARRGKPPPILFSRRIFRNNLHPAFFQKSRLPLAFPEPIKPAASRAVKPLDAGIAVAATLN
jgi:hypothetical protein